MPKQKTHKAASKRFTKTATGKIKYCHANAGHLMTGKSGKRGRNLRGKCVLSKTETKRIAPMLGK